MHTLIERTSMHWIMHGKSNCKMQPKNKKWKITKKKEEIVDNDDSTSCDTCIYSSPK